MSVSGSILSASYYDKHQPRRPFPIITYQFLGFSFQPHHPLQHRLPKLLIDRHQPHRPLPLKNLIHLLRLQNQRREDARALRCRHVCADDVPASRRLVEAVARVLDRHRVVVHFVEHGAGEHVHGDEGAVVGVRWRGRRGGEADFEPENAFVGGVAEFVFVEDFKGGWGGAGGESVLVEELVFGAGGSCLMS